MAEIKTAKRQTLQLMANEMYSRFAKKEDVKEYSLVKKQTAEEGFFASYNLTKAGEVVGDTINIPKDYLVKSATIATCSAANTPVEGYKKGDKYLDFVVNTTDGAGNESHIYIKVQELVDVYTGGNGINVGTDNTIAIKVDTTNAHGLSVGADGLALALATETTAGAMSADDKKKLNKAVTEETQLSLGEATGAGNVVTAVEVDGHKVTPVKGLTALTEADLVDFTQEEVAAIFNEAATV